MVGSLLGPEQVANSPLLLQPVEHLHFVVLHFIQVAPPFEGHWLSKN